MYDDAKLSLAELLIIFASLAIRFGVFLGNVADKIIDSVIIEEPIGILEMPDKEPQ